MSDRSRAVSGPSLRQRWFHEDMLEVFTPFDPKLFQQLCFDVVSSMSLLIAVTERRRVTDEELREALEHRLRSPRRRELVAA